MAVLRRRATRYCSCLVLLGAVLLPGVANANHRVSDVATTAGVPNDPPPSDPEPGPNAALAQLAANFHISEDEVRQSLAREPAVSNLQAAAQISLGTDYAGLWVDHENKGVVTIASTAYRPEAFSALSSAFPYPQYLEFRVVQRSLDDLQKLQTDVLTLNIEGSPSIDLDMNSVVFQPDGSLSDEDRKTLEGFVGSGLTISEALEYQVSTDCTGRLNCAPRYVAGSR